LIAVKSAHRPGRLSLDKCGKRGNLIDAARRTGLMDIGHYAGFLSGVILLLLMPGPTNTLIMTAGATQPLRRMLPLQAAEVAAYAIAVSLLVLLEAALGDWRSVGAVTLKSVAVAIILFLAYRLWRSRSLAAADSGMLISPKTIFFVTLFNPKSLVFAFAIFAPLHGLPDLAAKEAMFAVLVIVCGWAWIGAGHLLATGRLRGSSFIPALSAVALCCFAVYLGSSVVAEAAAMMG
jgi:threonine/homoserine/homoserine lactone efflux protein